MGKFGKPDWISWVNDPLIQTAGITFDRTPAGEIKAPPGKIRVCAYHIDFDERPTCYADVTSLAQAADICDNLSARCSKNVDYALAYDEHGTLVYGQGYG